MQASRHRRTKASMLVIVVAAGLALFAFQYASHLYLGLEHTTRVSMSESSHGNHSRSSLADEIDMRARAAPDAPAGMVESNEAIVEKDWTRALRKGEELCKLMIDPGAVQSPRTSYSQLDKYGWDKFELEKSEVPPAMEVPMSIKPPEGVLKFPKEQITEVTWSHDDKGEVEYHDMGVSKPYNPTRAYYRALCWPRSGIIASQDSVSPKVAVESVYEGLYRGGPVVPLGRQSDVLGLEYVHLVMDVKGEPSNLRYFFRSHIVNTTTQNVLYKALDGVGCHSGPPKWPGQEFLLESLEGKAIVGTPNGRAVALMLATRRADFGQKTIRSVRVFDDEIRDERREDYRKYSRPSLMFEIVDWVPTQVHGPRPASPEPDGSRAHKARL